MEKKTIYLLDGTNLLYRAFFAIRMLNSPSGQPSNAVYGMGAMLLKLIEDYKPDGIVVAFDKGKQTFRSKLYSEYKGTRQETPVELREQFEPAKELIRLLDIPMIESDEYEADDIIGTLAKKSESHGWTAKIVSGDKDLLQLIDENVEMLLVRKGMTDLERIDIPTFHEMYGILPSVFVDVKALMGDSSDNIPGVPGVGEKTALKLIKEYGSLDEVYNHVEELSGKKLKENLVANREKADLSRVLSEICCTMDLELDWENVHLTPHWDQVHEFFTQLGFKSLVKKIPVHVSEGNSTGELSGFSGELSYEKALPKKWVEKVLGTNCMENPFVVVPVLRNEFPRQHLGGFGMMLEGQPYFIPTNHKDWGQILRLLGNPEVVKATWQAKNLYRTLHSYDYDLRGVLLDAHLGAYLLKPGEGNLDEKSVWEEYGTGQLPIEPMEEEGKAVWMALFVHQVFPKITEELQALSQWDLMINLENPLTPVLADIEWEGVQIDAEKMGEMSVEFEKRLKELTLQIHEDAGETFNINSPKQLGVILFEKLGLPVLKKTKTGPSTDIEVLEELASQHPMVKHLVDYRHLSKLKSTYLDALPSLIDSRTGRLHTTFHQTVTATGRLSSSNPNLQNIPIRSEEGKRIRYFFVAGQNYDGILSADYSQIELRLLAHIAEDESMKGAFINHQDIHSRTASEVFGVPLDQVTREMRSHAKAVNFGIIYGISDYSLSKDIGVTRKEAGEYMEKYFARYPKIKATIEGLVEAGREKGYSETLFGRRRYIPDIKSSNYNRRSFAERIAMNMPIQGTAADIIKKAMIDVAFELKEKGLKSRMVLQVHDELVFEYVESELEILKSIVNEKMEGAAALNIPLEVEIAIGPNWAEAK